MLNGTFASCLPSLSSGLIKRWSKTDRRSSACLGALAILMGGSIAGKSALSQTLPTFDSLPTQPLALSQSDTALRRGSRGDAVSALQLRLAELNFYRGAIDGDFGSATEAAVIEFQQSRSLTPDGIVGSQTLAALRNEASAPPPISNLPPSSTGNLSTNVADRGGRYSIAELQRRLQRRGFYRGEIDGNPGAQTRAAVAAAQRAYNLRQSDILNGQF